MANGIIAGDFGIYLGAQSGAAADLLGPPDGDGVDSFR